MSIQSLKNEKGRFIYIKNEDGHFVCPQCGVVKQKQNTMNMHYHTHDETPSHTCKTCKKGFLQKQALDLHIQSRHPELLKDDSSTKKFKCPFDDCEFTAITKGNCIIHCLRVHFINEIDKIMIKDDDTKAICCSQCENEFQSSSAFFYHAKKCLPLSKHNLKHQKLIEII